MRVAVAVLDLGERKLYRLRIAMFGQEIDGRPSRISEFEQLGDFVESLTGGVIARVSHIVVPPGARFSFDQKEVSVTTAYHQREHRKFQVAIAFLALFQQDGVDVSLEMIDCDERFGDGVGERLGVTQADQQRSGEPGTLGDRDGVDRLVRLAGVVERLAHDGNDGAQMLARSQFGYHSTVRLVSGELRIDDIGDQLLARAHDGCRGFVAGALDAENVSVGHDTIVEEAFSHQLSAVSPSYNQTAMKQHAINIVRELRSRGFQAYFAGGCVRDMLLGVAPADYDVATDATPPEVMRIFPETYAVGAQFGVVLVPLRPPIQAKEAWGSPDENPHPSSTSLGGAPAREECRRSIPTTSR